MFLFPRNVRVVRYAPHMTTPPSNEDTASQLESILNAYGQSLENPPKATEPVPQPKVKVRQKVEADPASRLAFLLAQLPELESRKKEAEEQLSECKKAVQQEIAKTVADPEHVPDVFDIPADPYGAHPAYTLSAREGQWRLNTEAMKAREPETYVKWAVKGAGYWELKRVQKNRVHRG